METKIIASMIGNARIARKVVFSIILASGIIFLLWESFTGFMFWGFSGWNRVPMLILGWVNILIAIDYLGRGV